MGKLSRDKGKRGELEVAALIREHGFDDARRGRQFKGTADSPDVIGLPGCHVEVKRQETARPYEWLHKATVEADGKATPVVFHRRNNQPWIVILSAQDFLRTLAEAEYGK